MAHVAALPRLRMVLPGAWAAVPLDDPARVDALVTLLSQRASAAVGAEQGGEPETLRGELGRLAALGGQTVHVEIETDDPSMILTTWPAWRPLPSQFAAGDLADAGLRKRLGEDRAAVSVEHSRGYAAVRQSHRSTAEVLRTTTSGTAATYWISHPVSARVLAFTPIDPGECSEEEFAQRWDRVAAAVSWDDSDPLAP